MKTLIFVVGSITMALIGFIILWYLVSVVRNIIKFQREDKLNKIAGSFTRVILNMSISSMKEEYDLSRRAKFSYENIIFTFDNKMYLAKLFIECSFTDRNKIIKTLTPYSVGIWMFDPVDKNTVFKFILTEENKLKDVDYNKKFVKAIYKKLFKNEDGLWIRAEGFTYTKGEYL